jgi:hypothetical protein
MGGWTRCGLALGVCVTVLLAGCGSGGGNDDSGGSAATGAADAPEASQDSGGTEGRDVATIGNVTPDVSGDDRDIAYTASLSVTVEDVRDATARARTLTSNAGGRLHDEESSGSGSGASATLVLKVPPDRFQSVLDDLAALGDERSRSIKADDVTAEVVDLEARIRSATASVERTRALLAEAAEIGEIVVVEGELAKREAALEQLLGQQRVLEASVALATITVEFTQPADDVAAAGDDGGLPGPLDALQAGADSVLAVGNVVLLALAVALPWVPVAAAGLGVVWYVRRRRSVSPAA